MPANYDIYREQVAYLAQQTPVSILVNGSVTIFTTVILWNTAPDIWLFAWMMMQLVFTSFIYLLWRRGMRRSRLHNLPGGPVSRDRRSPLIPRAFLWGAIGGASWGATTYFLPDLPQTEQLALIIVLFGMSSGASSTLAAIPLAAASFILATLLPMIVYFFLQGTLTYSSLGVMGIIYTMALLYSTRTVYTSFLEASQNRRNNAALLDQIRDERKAAAETLLISEERYRDVVETIGDMIANTDARGNFLFANNSWRTTLGYNDTDLASLKFLDIVDDEYKETVLAVTRKVALEKYFTIEEFVFKAKDGARVWVEATVNPLFENGKLVRLHGIFRDIGLRKEMERSQKEAQSHLQHRVAEATRDLADINASLQQEVTERRQAERSWRNSEAQLRLILDSTVEAIYGVGLDGRCTFANDACATLLGYEEAVELLGADMHLLAHSHAMDTNQGMCSICDVHRINSRTQADDKYFSRRNGGLFPIEYSACSILREGQVMGGVVAFLDITGRRQAEEQLRQSQKMEAIGQLTGGIAHDFNNLLAIIAGNLDLLASSVDADNTTPNKLVQRRMEAALHAAERAGELTQRLLTFSRKKILSPQIIDPGAMVAGMSEILRRTLGSGIICDIQMAAPLWSVFTDPSLFENALLNLSINARDAMAGGGVLTIEIVNVSLDAPLILPRMQAPPGDYVKLSVRDTGTGIAPDILDRVFEPFFTTKDVGQGTGLGLSMVFGFIEQSNGFIHIESALGSGTIISIYLPRAPAIETKTPRQEESPVNGFAASVNMHPADICILVVEDNPAVRQSSVAQIKELGYKVLAAEDGPSGLALFMQNPGINLVYTDIMMPNGMNGPVLAERILALDPNIKVLFCTGYDGDYQNASNLPGNVILQKPVRKSVLAEKLREVLTG